MPNVVLLPHIGGGTRQSRLEARRLCAQNVANVLRGSLPLSPV
jgi:phosphoglycerate dehydrogenase-like enzyme